MSKVDISHLYAMPSYDHGGKKLPVVGITVDMVDTRIDVDSTWYSVYPWYAIGRRYCDSIVRAGGAPVMLCYNLSNIISYAETIDALLVTGIGSDIDPTFYGEKFKHKATVSRPMKTQFEWAMIQKMIDMNKPILGINVGMQLINVAYGGTLTQHILEEFPNAISHMQQRSLALASHTVKISKKTKLYKCLQEFDVGCISSLKSDDNFLVLETNSYHRQALNKLGKGLKVNAIAEDGMIEGIESTENNFCMGVQWNAEFLINCADSSLFRAFVEATFCEV
jgi:putative glutamine amidotransferase